jgi:hypothetical protein
MADEGKSFEELVREVPPAPAAGTVSLVGTLAQSSEAGKFVLALQDGNVLTLEIADVKGHEVLGTSVGHTIVRVDVEAEKIPASPPAPGTAQQSSPQVAPFALATPYQAPPTPGAPQAAGWYGYRTGQWAADVRTYYPTADLLHTFPAADGPRDFFAAPNTAPETAQQSSPQVAPFALATPYHAPPIPVAPQAYWYASDTWHTNQRTLDFQTYPWGIADGHDGPISWT